MPDSQLSRMRLQIKLFTLFSASTFYSKIVYFLFVTKQKDTMIILSKFIEFDVFLWKSTVVLKVSARRTRI